MNRGESAAAEKSYGMTMEKRSRAAITGVTDVESFDETAVILHTHGGRLILTGSGLHVAFGRALSGINCGITVSFACCRHGKRQKECQGHFTF